MGTCMCGVLGGAQLKYVIAINCEGAAESPKIKK